MRPLKNSKNLMNAPEENFAWLSEKRKLAGEIIGWRHHPCTLVLAEAIPNARKKTTYEPDFLIIHKDNFEFVEIKVKSKPKFIKNKNGKVVKKQWTSMRDDAAVKIKIASELFPWFQWTISWLIDGQWIEEKVN